MVTLTFFAVVIVLVAIMVRGSTLGPLDSTERLFLLLAAIPAVLALLLPGLLGQLMSGSESARPWGLRLNVAGGWLSLALIGAGAFLLVRRSRRQQGWDRRLLAGLTVAALPAVLIGLVALMYAL